MIKEHTRMAFSSLNASKLRSTMTMFGIVISVAAVVTVVGLGEGLQQQVTKQVSKLGGNLIIVQPGKAVTSDPFSMQSLQSMSNLEGGILTEKDYEVVSKLSNIANITPVATLSGAPVYEGTKGTQSVVIGANESLPEILDKKVEYGSFFTKEELQRNYAVIGRNVAEDLFKENVPIGKTFQIRGQEFIVQGVFEQTPITPLSPSTNFNNAVVIPYIKAKEVGTDTVRINQILINTTDKAATETTASSIKNALLINHGGQLDFSVLSQNETLSFSSSVFDQLTAFVTGVSIIALLVGSVGVSNIMLASVSERTREIGIRKSVGATNRQIMNQFITEAVVLSTTGGIIGLAVSGIAIICIRVTSNLEPVFVPSAIGIALGVSVGVGILAGTLPALKASKKDPIESLRGI